MRGKTMNDLEKYAFYKQARETGGPCEICGWKDGDGTRACFYGKELGTVRHENSMQAVTRQMTPSQQELLRSADSLHNEFEHSADHSTCLKSLDYNGKWITGRYVLPHTCGGQFVQQLGVDPVEHVIPWKCTGCGEIVKRWQGLPNELFWGHKHVEGDHGTCIQTSPASESCNASSLSSREGHPASYRFAHSCGKGYGRDAAPYELYCTGCDEEVKLWEFGIDPDMG
jgi:hypothetical protein